MNIVFVIAAAASAAAVVIVHVVVVSSSRSSIHTDIRIGLAIRPGWRWEVSLRFPFLSVFSLIPDGFGTDGLEPMRQAVSTVRLFRHTICLRPG